MKIIGESTCPNCKKDHEVTLDIDKLDIKQPITSLNNPSTQGTIQQTIQEVIEPVKEKIVTKIPSYIPKYKCKNCDKPHENKDYSKIPRFKCDKCGQLSPDGSECLFCENKEFDELDDEDLEDMGIIKPKEQEHEHEE